MPQKQACEHIKQHTKTSMRSKARIECAKDFFSILRATKSRLLKLLQLFSSNLVQVDSGDAIHHLAQDNMQSAASHDYRVS